MYAQTRQCDRNAFEIIILIPVSGIKILFELKVSFVMEVSIVRFVFNDISGDLHHDG